MLPRVLIGAFFAVVVQASHAGTFATTELTLEVVGLDGRPVSGASVNFLLSGEGKGPCSTDTKGRCRYRSHFPFMAFEVSKDGYQTIKELRVYPDDRGLVRRSLLTPDESEAKAKAEKARAEAAANAKAASDAEAKQRRPSEVRELSDDIICLGVGQIYRGQSLADALLLQSGDEKLVSSEFKRRNLKIEKSGLQSGDLHRGMNKCTLFAIFGYPSDINRHTGKFGIREQYVYRSGASAYFPKTMYVYLQNGRVDSWQD